MKKPLIILMLLGIMAGGCEFRNLSFSIPYFESGNYTINQIGAFTETATFTLEETIDALDLPDNVQMDSIYIKSISIKGKVLTGNEATGLNVQGSLTYDNQTLTLFNPNYVVIESGDIVELGMKDLNPAAISLLKKFMTAEIFYFLGIPIGPFNLTDEFFTITISGTPTPSQSSQINLIVDVNIAFDLSYHACIETIPFIGTECHQ